MSIKEDVFALRQQHLDQITSWLCQLTLYPDGLFQLWSKVLTNESTHMYLGAVNERQGSSQPNCPKTVWSHWDYMEISYTGGLNAQEIKNYFERGKGSLPKNAFKLSIDKPQFYSVTLPIEQLLTYEVQARPTAEIGYHFSRKPAHLTEKTPKMLYDEFILKHRIAYSDDEIRTRIVQGLAESDHDTWFSVKIDDPMLWSMWHYVQASDELTSGLGDQTLYISVKE